MQELSRVSFFTAWNICADDKTHIYKNEYAHFKSKMHSLNHIDAIYFLGQPILDRNAMRLDVLVKYYERIKDYFAGKDIIYLPHRDECQNCLDVLADKTGFKIMKFGLPIEYVLCAIGPIPNAVASFGSSALQSCHSILNGKIKVVSFYINSRDLSVGGNDLDVIFKYFVENKSDYLIPVRIEI